VPTETKAPEKQRVPKNRQKMPPAKKAPPRDSKWLTEKPVQPKQEKAAYKKSTDDKARRIKELRESREAEMYKQKRLEELKDKARLDSIRQEAATTGMEAERKPSETEKSRLLEDYGERIQAIIYGNWVYALAREDMDLVTKVSVTVRRDGTMNVNKVVEPSGDRAFDQSALRAIRKTGKVEPPPFGRDEEVILNFYPE
jgi:TonB family protein